VLVASRHHVRIYSRLVVVAEGIASVRRSVGLFSVYAFGIPGMSASPTSQKIRLYHILGSGNSEKEKLWNPRKISSSTFPRNA
jgi:hypothetical protein